MTRLSQQVYLSRGKRGILERQYQADLNVWAKALRVPLPTVKVRVRKAGRYYPNRALISVPPNAHRDSLVHEFAHHLDHFAYRGVGHGPSFRVSLVQVATVAYGRADRYEWSREYTNVQKWAQAHGLAPQAPDSKAPRRRRTGLATLTDLGAS